MKSINVNNILVSYYKTES